MGRIDHLAFDVAGRRLFVAELGNDAVSAIDITSGEVLHRITGLKEPQGVAYLPGRDLMIVASGGSGDVTAFSATDFSKAWSVALGSDADNVRIDTDTDEIFVGYGSDLAVLDGVGRLIHKVPLSGHPEAFQVGADRVIVNVPSAREIAAIDRRSWDVLRWPVNNLRANFPMALDDSRNRVLVVFRDPARLGEFDSKTGEQVRTVATCGDSDDVWIDAIRQRAYVSCGDGHVAVIHRDASTLKQIDKLRTVEGARTSLFVPDLGLLFVAARARGAERAAIWVFRAGD
jgi:YVTN family beta-propeller protein